MAISPRKIRQKRLEAARGYLQLGMPVQASRELDKVPDSLRDNFDFQILKGESLRESEQYADAVDHFKEALDLRPENLQGFLGLAWCYKRLDQLQAAIDTLEIGRTYHPDESIVIYNLACYFSLQQNKSKAIECLGRSLRMEPDLVELIRDETDFDSLREDPDFCFVISAVSSSDESS